MKPRVMMRVERDGEVEYDGAMMKEGYALTVRDGDVLIVEAFIIMPEMEYEYLPRTLPIFFSIKPNTVEPPVSYLEKPARYNKDAECYEAKLELEIKRQWFINEKVKTLAAQYPGGDEVIYVKHEWKRLGRLGWLSKKRVRAILEDDSTYINLIFYE